MLEKTCLRQSQIGKSPILIPEWAGNGVGNCNECLYNPENKKKCNDYHPVLITFYVHSKEERKKHEEEIIKYERVGEH